MSEKVGDGTINEKVEMQDHDTALKEEIHDYPNEENGEPKELGHGGDTALANAPWKFKLIALATALMLPVGSHFSASAISAMKATVKTQLNIDNTRYGVLSSAVSIINTIFPIAGGMFIDMFGSIWGTLAVNFAIIVGSLLTAIAAKYETFALMVVGRVIFGIGSGLIVTMQESLLSKWFRTQHLAFAIGLQLSISRLSSFLGTLVSNPIYEATDDWVWPFWLSLFFCVFSIVMNVVYAGVVKHLRGSVSLTKAEFPHIYWLIIFIEFIFASLWSSFQTIATELIQVHFGSSKVLAGYKASASQVVPIVATPLLGLIMDYFGFRVIILWLSAVFFILSSGLLGWTYVDAAVGMVFYSFSLAFGPIAMITSIGMLLPSDYIGTGLGIYKSSNNIGTTILDIVIGVVQDKTANQAYTNVMLLFIILAAVGFLLIIGLWAVQKWGYDNLLECKRATRLERMKEINDKELELTKHNKDAYSNTPVVFTNYFYVAFFLAALVVAWVLFFVYAANGHIAA
ncbi:major facilitator superfamily domain-containing protein [Absidia repens]|uniref:Lysosomal dipeptide transporter MFSD1 n=1 Tax=Absidia repens TaxID=90262 RepID=A0A1X2I749_9FUNG|nr:major facilitator superfamily domain-containing protein [Absidia repens]